MGFQTFSLECGAGLLIKGALLDRFLACMKPASITQRPPCAGVFFGSPRKSVIGISVQFADAAHMLQRNVYWEKEHERQR